MSMGGDYSLSAAMIMETSTISLGIDDLDGFSVKDPGDR